jgi:hypothetical protein
MATVRVIHPKIAEFGASITNQPQDAFGPENPYLSTKAAALSLPQLTITHPHDLVADDDETREHLSMAKADLHPLQCSLLKLLPDGNDIVELVKITESHPGLLRVIICHSPTCLHCLGKGKPREVCNSPTLRLESFQIVESRDSKLATLRQQVRDGKTDTDIAKETVSDETFRIVLQPSSSSGDKEDRPSCPSNCSSTGHASELGQPSSEIEIVGTEGIKVKAPPGPSKGNKSRKRMNTSPEPSNKRRTGTRAWTDQTWWHCVSFLGLFAPALQTFI